MSSVIPTTSTIAASATTTTYANRAAFLVATSVQAPPPPGVTPNFDAPNPNGVFMIVTNIVGVIVCTTITAMRFWTKGVLMRTVGWDDYTCGLTMVGIMIWAVSQIQIALWGFGRHDWDIRTTNTIFQLKGKYQFLAQDAILFSLGSVKVSILLMYLRAFTGNKRFKYTVWVLIVLIISAHLVAFFGWTFSTLPVSCHWTFYPTPGEFLAHCHHPSIQPKLPDYNLFLLIFTVTMDLLILYLPCKPVWRLQLAKRQRISILAILFAGAIVTLASLIRLVYYVRRFYSHAQFDNSLTEFRVNVVTTIEVDLAQLCCCLPILKPFVRKFVPSLLRLHIHTTRSKERTSAHPAVSAQHPIKAGRKWPGAGSRSRDEELIGADYLELGEDGKSDQSYVMSTVAVNQGK